MYTALLECVTTPGQDGMRFALFLINLAVFKDLYLKQVFRATVRPWCHLFLRQQTWQDVLLLVRTGEKAARVAVIWFHGKCPLQVSNRQVVFACVEIVPALVGVYSDAIFVLSSSSARVLSPHASAMRPIAMR